MVDITLERAGLPSFGEPAAALMANHVRAILVPSARKLPTTLVGRVLSPAWSSSG